MTEAGEVKRLDHSLAWRMALKLNDTEHFEILNRYIAQAEAIERGLVAAVQLGHDKDREITAYEARWEAATGRAENAEASRDASQAALVVALREKRETEANRDGWQAKASLLGDKLASERAGRGHLERALVKVCKSFRVYCADKSPAPRLLWIDLCDAITEADGNPGPSGEPSRDCALQPDGSTPAPPSEAPDAIDDDGDMIVARKPEGPASPVAKGEAEGCPIEFFIGFKQPDGSYRYAVADEADFNMNGYVRVDTLTYHDGSGPLRSQGPINEASSPVAPAAEVMPVATAGAGENCGNCWMCTNAHHKLRSRMLLCPTCGNKRCPKANDHRNECSGSNEPGQLGSAYAFVPPPASPPAWTPRVGDRVRNRLAPTDLGAVQETDPVFAQFGVPVIWDKSPGHLFYVSIAQLVRVVETPTPPASFVSTARLVAALRKAARNDELSWEEALLQACDELERSGDVRS